MLSGIAGNVVSDAADNGSRL